MSIKFTSLPFHAKFMMHLLNCCVVFEHLNCKTRRFNINKGTYKYDAIKRCQPLVWGNMTHDDASVETGVGGQAKYDVMMVFCGNALQQHHETLKTSSSWYSDCHTAHFFIY